MSGLVLKIGFPTTVIQSVIVGNGVNQHLTYIREGADDEPDWFEPYYFGHDDICKAELNKVTHWMPLPDPPKTRD